MVLIAATDSEQAQAGAHAPLRCRQEDRAQCVIAAAVGWGEAGC